MKTFLPGVTTLKERITPEASRQEQQETDLLFECVHLEGDMNDDLAHRAGVEQVS